MRVCTEGPRWSSGRAPVLQHRTRRWLLALLYRRLRAIHGRVVAARSYYRVANPVITGSHQLEVIYKIYVVKAVILARFDGC